MTQPLPPIKQEFYDDNRKRFDAETFSTELKTLTNKCSHYLIRKSPTVVECKLCPVGWNDGGHFIIKDGKLVGIK